LVYFMVIWYIFPRCTEKNLAALSFVHSSRGSHHWNNFWRLSYTRVGRGVNFQVQFLAIPNCSRLTVN
jgi:hypothetical protein